MGHLASILECLKLKKKKNKEKRTDCTVVMSSANGLVGTGFAYWYQLQLRTGF